MQLAAAMAASDQKCADEVWRKADFLKNRFLAAQSWSNFHVFDDDVDHIMDERAVRVRRWRTERRAVNEESGALHALTRGCALRTGRSWARPRTA